MYSQFVLSNCILFGNILKWSVNILSHYILFYIHTLVYLLATPSVSSATPSSFCCCNCRLLSRLLTGCNDDKLEFVCQRWGNASLLTEYRIIIITMVNSWAGMLQWISGCCYGNSAIVIRLLEPVNDTPPPGNCW